MIKEVGLEGERRRFAKDLSGGQKRRLSVAISVLSEYFITSNFIAYWKSRCFILRWTNNVSIVNFLVDKFSGLDPSSKRGLWDIILAARQKHSIVLTTHSMEEAEVLSTRIGNWSIENPLTN